MGIPTSSLTLFQVKLEIGIGCGNVDDMLHGGRVKWRPSEIGMNHHACGIDDATKPGADLKADLLLKEGKKAIEGEETLIGGRGFFPGEDLLTKRLQSSTDRFENHRSRMEAEEIRDLRFREELLHARDLTKKLLAKGG